MSARSATFYWAVCDGNGCDRDTRMDNNAVYDSVQQLAEQFHDGPKPFEDDTLFDSHGWIQTGEHHYCPDHNYFDDHTDTRVPLPAGRLDLSGKDAA